MSDNTSCPIIDTVPYVPPCHEECPLGEGTWHILHNHKASERSKHFKCNFESESTFAVVHIERVLNCLWAKIELASTCVECTYIGSVKATLSHVCADYAWMYSASISRLPFSSPHSPFVGNNQHEGATAGDCLCCLVSCLEY